jgi:outer membrane protein W
MKSIANGSLRVLRRVSFVLVTVAPAILAESAYAQEDPRTGDIRVGIFAGGVAMNTVSWSGTGTLNSLPASAAGHVDTKTGTAFGGLLGYGFNSYLNIELDAGVVTNRFKSFEGAIAIAGVGSFNGKIPVSGRIQTIATFMNGLVTPLGQDNGVVPFFGIGIGLAHSSARLDQFTIGPVAFPVGSHSSETDLAADATIGFDVKLTPEIGLGIAYQYMWIDSKHLGSGVGFQANTGHTTGHVLGVLLEYEFQNTR